MRTTFVLSGTPESYSTTDRDNIKRTIADAVNVPYGAVEISLIAASTRVEVTITLPDQSSALAAQSTFNTGILASAASLQSALAANGVATTVLTAPTLTLGVATVSPPPPPSSSLSPPPPSSSAAVSSDQSSDGASSSNMGMIIGIIAGAAVVVALIIAFAVCYAFDACDVCKKSSGGVVVLQSVPVAEGRAVPVQEELKMGIAVQSASDVTDEERL